MNFRNAYLVRLSFITAFIILFVSLDRKTAYSDWISQTTTIGEGIPAFVASNKSSDNSLTFNVEFSQDEICTPALFLLQNKEKEYIKFGEIKSVMISSSHYGVFKMVFHKANYRVLQLKIRDKLMMSLLQALQSDEKFYVSINLGNAKVTKEFYRGNSSMIICGAQKLCWPLLINETGFIFSHSDKKLLKNHELYYLPENILKIARNEIFARHGYVFKSSDLSEHFSKQNWYQPNEGKIILTDLEKKNISLISSFEKSVKLDCPEKGAVK